MKKIVLFCATLLLFILSVKSQDKITSYVGLVGSISTNTDTNLYWMNLRVGVTMQEQFGKNIIIAGIGYDPGGEFTYLCAYLKRKWDKGFGFSTGFQATPMTEIRPRPFSVDGQFPFTAEAMPPGGALGISIWYKNVKAGLYVRKKKPEYQISFVDNDSIFYLGFWRNRFEPLGITSKIEISYLYSMVTYTNRKQAVVLALNPIKKIPLRIFWDFAYLGKEKKVSSNVIGVIHPFSFNPSYKDTRLGAYYDLKKNFFSVFVTVSN